MLGLPRSNLYLFRYYDYANRIDGGFDEEEGTIFTLREYLDHLDDFHPKDTFGIFFDADLENEDTEDYTCINRAEEATTSSLQEHVDIFLEVFCEQQLRRNTPFELTAETIANYGFTPDEVEQLQKPITHYNKSAKERIRAEYDELSKLDFICNGE